MQAASVTPGTACLAGGWLAAPTGSQGRGAESWAPPDPQQLPRAGPAPPACAALPAGVERLVSQRWQPARPASSPRAWLLLSSCNALLHPQKTLVFAVYEVFAYLAVDDVVIPPFFCVLLAEPKLISISPVTPDAPGF